MKRWVLGGDVFAHRDVCPVLLDQLADIVTVRPERQSGERTRDGHARAERRVLVDSERLLVAGDGQHIEWGAGAAGHFERR